MTTFKLGFLLAFSLVHKENLARNKKDEKKGKKDTKSIGSKKGSSKSSKRGSSRASKRKTKEPIEFPPYVLDVGNPVGYIHIEYDLTWEKGQKQQIDIVCWKGVVKVKFIYNIALKALSRENHRFFSGMKSFLIVFVQQKRHFGYPFLFDI